MITTELKQYSFSDLHSEDRGENKSEEMEENNTMVKADIASARERNLNNMSLLINIRLSNMKIIIFLIVYSNFHRDA